MKYAGRLLGQIFEYASRLWETRYADFDDYFSKAAGVSLIDQFSSREGFDAELFRRTVDERLRRGQFHLLIAVDEVNQDLIRILRYISSRGDSVSLEALEVRAFQCGDFEVLVPQRHAIAGESVTGNNSRVSTNISIEELLDKSADDDMRSKIERIVDLWRESGNTVITTEKTFCLKTLGIKRLFSMMWASPNEDWGLQPNFGGMNDAGMPTELVQRVRDQIAQVPNVPKEKTLLKSYPSLKFSGLPLESVVRITEIMINAARDWHDLLAKAE